MFGYRIDQYKGAFFDRKAVTGAMDRTTARVLSKFGAFVRTRARTSIRKRKDVSDPGDPPSSHLGLLRQWVLFAYERERKSVVIGPAKLNARIGNAPEALEKGGPSQLLKKHANGTATIETIQVREHPYMQPAFDAELPGMPAMWKDAMAK